MWVRLYLMEAQHDMQNITIRASSGDVMGGSPVKGNTKTIIGTQN